MSAELELARLERRVLGISRVKSFLDAVEELRRMLGREDPRLRERILLLAAPIIGRDLVSAVAEAFGAGLDDAISVLGEGRPDRVRQTPPDVMLIAAMDLETRLGEELATARRLIRANADPATALAPVLGAANTLNRNVTSLINGAGNAGSAAVADAAGVPTVWIAETNACVHCLAYSGQVADPGGTFPGGLTYGPKAYFIEALAYPPLHPNCRCTVEPLQAQSFADALRREADRSVLRGFSLESESMKVRIEAARRLLDEGVDAPKSVLAYARRAVRDGEFPTRGRQ